MRPLPLALRGVGRPEALSKFAPALKAGAAPPSPAYVQTRRRFNNDYLTKTIASGLADGASGTFSIWLDFKGGNGSLQSIHRLSAGRVDISKNSANKLAVILRNSSGTSLVSMTTDTTYTSSTGLIHVIMAWNLVGGSPVFKLRVNKVDVAKTFTTSPTAGNVDYFRSGIASAIGGTEAGASLLDAEVGDLYANYSTYLDIDDAGVLAKFIDGDGNPVSLGSTFELPTGTSPDFGFGGAMSEAAWEAGTGYGANGTGWTLTGDLA